MSGAEFAPQDAALSDSEMLRYHRQISLKAFDFAGQERLKAARVLVIGAGGLGCAASQYLVSAGIGQLTLVDFDTIAPSNLQRQVLYRDSDVGQPKVKVAAQVLRALNPHCHLVAVNQRADAALLGALLAEHDLVLDGSDNVATRNLINLCARAARVPLVSGAAIRFEGQLTSFTWQESEPCYGCLSMLFGASTLSCVEAGVMAPMVGIIGSWQALEAIKLLTGIGQGYQGRLLLIDGLSGQVRQLNLSRQAACPVCGSASVD
ncbi:MAG: molybdopterin-synthase adenylyltransferase MoeB [Aeromonas sp.]